EYMVDEETSTGRRSAVGMLLIINILVWVAWRIALSHPQFYEFMAEYFRVSHKGVVDNYQIFTLFTSAISHRDPEHIFFNMLFFWFVADDVERVYGRLNFFVLYFFCGLVSSLTYIIAEPMGVALGASGAIMGIAVVAAIFDPNRPVSVFGFITLPLKWLV